MEQLKLVGQVCSVVSSIRSLKKTNKLLIILEGAWLSIRCLLPPTVTSPLG